MGNRGEEFVVLALFSSELCNYQNPVHTRPYPELGNRRGIHRFVHLAIVVWAVAGHCWGPHTGFTHSKFRHSHLPWKSAITHPVPPFGPARKHRRRTLKEAKRITVTKERELRLWWSFLRFRFFCVCLCYICYCWLHNVPTFLSNLFLLAHHKLNVSLHSLSYK